MKRKVTREGVELAIQQIEASGNKATIERIRAITGGSPKTIGEIKNAISRGETDHSTLPLFDNVGTVSLSYHNLTDKVDAMITQRIDNLVMRRLDSVLSRLEGGSQEATPLPATTIEENEAPDDELGEMRELWFEACDQLSEARQEAKEHWQRFKNAQKELSEAKQDVTALTKDFAQLQKTLKAAQNGLADASSQIKELEKEKMSEGPSRNDKGERVYKSELALAVRHLVMTAGMSQKDVGELLGLSTSEVSQLKNKGTKLHQKRAKSE